MRGGRRIGGGAMLVVFALLLWGLLSGPPDPGEMLSGLRGHGLDGGALGGGARGTPSGASASLLAGLPVRPAGSMAGYSREKFPHWEGAAQSGWRLPPGVTGSADCDARDAALIRDGRGVAVGDYCDVESGRWFDPYTGHTYYRPSDIDIDHVVPLADAWRSGASSWSVARRERYANDPEVLLSVEDNANQEKGDKGPEAWKPPRRAEWCDYAIRWVRIKADYGLSVTAGEKSALTGMLSTCGARRVGAGSS